MFMECNTDLFEEAGKEHAVTIKYIKAPVYYLLSRRGNAMEIHVATEGREGKRLIREASRAVIQWVKDTYPWCEMLIAPVAIKSVYNLCLKIGFKDLGVFEFDKGRANVMVVDYELCR